MNAVHFWEDQSCVERGDFPDAKLALEAAQVWTHVAGRSAVCYDKYGRPALTMWHDGEVCCISAPRKSAGRWQAAAPNEREDEV